MAEKLFENCQLAHREGVDSIYRPSKKYPAHETILLMPKPVCNGQNL